MPTDLKSGILKLLEPSQPIQACTGIALPLPLPLPYYCCVMPSTASMKLNSDVRLKLASVLQIPNSDKAITLTTEESCFDS
jgi:hypothetical protein